MKVVIKRNGERYSADPVDLPGSPAVGRGDSMLEALGEFVHLHREKLGIEIELDPSAEAMERARRPLDLEQR